MKQSLRFPVCFVCWIVLGGIAVLPVLAQNHLDVLEPRQSWFREPGTIEAATIEVRPKGIYAEVGLDLTFSARNTAFDATDSLEVALYFTLPKSAVMTDSWLWIGDDIIRADIIDAWTASTIYEDIVRRRRDPSILFKRGPRDYELRIFPMAANETRRVKLTYLVPTQWTARAVTVPLPAEVLQTSWHTVPVVRVRAQADATWQAPRLVEHPDWSFQVDGSGATSAVPGNALQGSLTLAFDSPLRDGFFVSRTPDTDENWYQMALLPSEALDLSDPRKVAVLLDYDAAKTDIARDDLLGTVRSLLHTSLAADDAFNLIVARLNVQRVSETWLPADSATIEAAFESLGNDPLGGYSNLPALLADGIEFVDTESEGGTLLLLSSSDQVGEAEVANELIDDLQAATPALPPIHVVDFTNRNFARYQVGGRSFPGNSYFYTNVTRRTGGNYLNVRDDGGFAQVMADGFGALGGLLNAFDLYTTLTSGFCYARFTSGGVDQAVYRDQAVVQVGKCFGASSFAIEASGVFEGMPFSQRLEPGADAVRAADTTLVALWTGRQVQALEAGPQTNDVITRIIDYSLDQRVLSLYTAFLALEPSQGGEVCNACQEENSDDGGDVVPIDTEDETPLPEEAVLTVYPNPFTTAATIKVALPEPTAATDVDVHVFNAMGQVVKTLRAEDAGVVRTFALTWDGTNDAGQRVASGTYFVVVTTPAGRYTVTLVLVR